MVIFWGTLLEKKALKWNTKLDATKPSLHCIFKPMFLQKKPPSRNLGKIYSFGNFGNTRWNQCHDNLRLHTSSLRCHRETPEMRGASSGARRESYWRQCCQRWGQYSVTLSSILLSQRKNLEASSCIGGKYRIVTFSRVLPGVDFGSLPLFASLNKHISPRFFYHTCNVKRAAWAWPHNSTQLSNHCL